VDIWHAYEAGFLTNKGLPVTGVLKIAYPASSSFIVESKSLKLYLNSLNMEMFGNTQKEAEEEVLKTIKSDLEKALSTSVKIHFFRKDAFFPLGLDHFERLEELPGIEDHTFSEFSENQDLLVPGSNGNGEIKVATHLLRSNCKITHQPDWGSVYIHLKGDSIPDKIHLLKYLVSLRNENHFHEEICEMVYKRLWDHFSPEELLVVCIYTRRGGIDICPVRASDDALFPANLIHAEKMTKKLLRQ
jgi:7-cyano-7-deazaguanine reductase